MATIYKIEFNEYIYIGSTNDIKKRQRYHNSILTADEDNVKTKYTLYSTARENGIKEFEFIELEKCSIDDRFIREQHYIDLNKGDKLLNCYSAYGFDKKKYYEKNKAIRKIYAEKNADTIKDYKKQWHQDNKERIADIAKQRYQKNKDIINQRDKAYREKNKDIINQRRRKAYREKKKQAELNDI